MLRSPEEQGAQAGKVQSRALGDRIFELLQSPITGRPKSYGVAGFRRMATQSQGSQAANVQRMTLRVATSPTFRSRVTCYTDSVPRNLTLTLDEELLRAARKVALDRNTSVNQLVREFLANLVQETDQRKAARAAIEEIFRTNQLEIGVRSWQREDLHER